MWPTNRQFGSRMERVQQVSKPKHMGGRSWCLYRTACLVFVLLICSISIHSIALCANHKKVSKGSEAGESTLYDLETNFTLKEVRVGHVSRNSATSYWFVSLRCNLQTKQKGPVFVLDQSSKEGFCVFEAVSIACSPGEQVKSPRPDDEWPFQVNRVDTSDPNVKAKWNVKAGSVSLVQEFPLLAGNVFSIQIETTPANRLDGTTVQLVKSVTGIDDSGLGSAKLELVRPGSVLNIRACER